MDPLLKILMASWVAFILILMAWTFIELRKGAGKIAATILLITIFMIFFILVWMVSDIIKMP